MLATADKKVCNSIFSNLFKLLLFVNAAFAKSRQISVWSRRLVASLRMCVRCGVKD